MAKAQEKAKRRKVATSDAAFAHFLVWGGTTKVNEAQPGFHGRVRKPPLDHPSSFPGDTPLHLL